MAGTVAEAGERVLTRLILEQIGAAGRELLVGPGDDAACVRWPENTAILTVDALVEGVHFTPVGAHAGDLGYKALAISLSDVAAMAGRPRYALVAATLRPETEVEWVRRFYRGLLELADEFGVEVVGGNLSRSTVTSFTVTVIGEAVEAQCLVRGGAQPRDRILVTGSLGAARAGLLATAEDGESGEDVAGLLRAFRRPRPRIREAAAAAKAGVTALTDVSDGLAADIANLADASDLGAFLKGEALPIPPELTRFARSRGLPMPDFAIGGGEEYELLMTASPKESGAVRAAIHRETGTEVREIGEMTADRSLVVADENGATRPLRDAGFDHFSPTGR